jgi:hypothetical protein
MFFFCEEDSYYKENENSSRLFDDCNPKHFEREEDENYIARHQSFS